MICEICKKKTATIHIQEIISGKKKALHICADCAANKSEDDPVFQGINLAEMLYNLSSQIDVSPEEQEGHPTDEETPSVIVICPNCAWDSNKFKKSGRLGCAHCYSIFNEILANAFKNMHRGTLHVGKRPGTLKDDGESAIMNDIMRLQKDLDDAVLREEYEKAAVLRDEINSLKEKRKNS